MKNKKIIGFLPLIMMTVWTFIIMIRSYKSDVQWKIIFSTIGFAIFLILTLVYIYLLSKKNTIK